MPQGTEPGNFSDETRKTQKIAWICTCVDNVLPFSHININKRVYKDFTLFFYFVNTHLPHIWQKMFGRFAKSASET